MDLDKDADRSCAVSFKGAWWYNACYNSNLNGQYLNGSHSSFADGVNWRFWLGYYLDPQLFLDKSPIPVVEETKFLGVIFDRKLSFVPHLKYVKKRALKALNILKVIGNTE